MRCRPAHAFVLFYCIAMMSFVMTPTVSATVITYQAPAGLITSPDFTLKANNLPRLAIFANPPEVDPPREGDPGVIYFGPVIHNPGLITLQSNQFVRNVKFIR